MKNINQPVSNPLRLHKKRLELVNRQAELKSKIKMIYTDSFTQKTMLRLLDLHPDYIERLIVNYTEKP